VHYVVEPADWAIAHDGRYVVDGLRALGAVPAYVTRSPLGLRRQVVHFGSRNLYMLAGYRDVDASNRVAMTWYHGSPADPNPENQAMIAALPERSRGLQMVTTASSLARDRLAGWGVPLEKIVVVPIGVDLRIFRPDTAGLRPAVRQALGIGEDQVCLGLFQKDGEGWGKGLRPKWVKAPDVFLQVVERLAVRYPLFVLLTGPARGFVLEGLRRLGVPHRHLRLGELAQVARCYHALDLYVVPSREEGGPKALLECFASGIPVVSTRVGMAADLIRHGENALLVDVDDAAGLAAAAGTVIESPNLRRKLTQAALEDVRPYDWPRVSQLYYQHVYRPLLAAPGLE
jgi:glycosyltransferase involved in cell wall biosynthesis